MKFKSDVRLIDFDLRAYKNRLDDFLREEIVESARSWLRTVLVIIPTWSRASRATFEALANEVGFNVTYGPRLSKKDRLPLGLSTSTGGLQITKFKSYHFFYETNLRYLAFNNLNRAIKGVAPGVFAGLIHDTPYKFTEAGAEDFKSRSAQIKLPNPMDFIKGKRI